MATENRTTPDGQPSASSIAIHEAGHATVAMFFEWLGDDHKVSLEPSQEDDWLGICEHHNPFASQDFDFRYCSNRNLIGMPEDAAARAMLEDDAKQALYREEAEHSVMLAQAGEVAEMLGDPSIDQPTGCESDRRTAFDLIESLIESRHEPGDWDAQVEPYRQWLEVRTRLLLQANWTRVQRVADLLMERGTITGAQAADAIRRAGPAASLLYGKEC